MFDKGEFWTLKRHPTDAFCSGYWGRECSKGGHIESSAKDGVPVPHSYRCPGNWALRTLSTRSRVKAGGVACTDKGGGVFSLGSLSFSQQDHPTPTRMLTLLHSSIPPWEWGDFISETLSAQISVSYTSQRCPLPPSLVTMIHVLSSRTHQVLKLIQKCASHHLSHA